MSILFSEQIQKQIVEEISNTTYTLQIISAYCKKSAICFVENSVKNALNTKRLMVRFTLDDILSGASDLDVYTFCKANGWQMYLRFDLHAKTYVFDNKRCIVGSANLTPRGIGLNTASNYELATLAELNNDEMKKINGLFENAVLITDELYYKMDTEIKAVTQNGIGKIKSWSEEILAMFTPDFSVLFTYDLPNCKSIKEISEDSLEFLNLPSHSSIDEVKTAFRWSKAYLWLYNTLLKNNKELYFGSLSEKLHNVLVNDPKPYRKDVKEHLQNLLNWVVELEMENIIIDRPNYSQRIVLKVV